jgi:ABC-type protease/lipase transport system fused ATPase/permease subunit
MSIIQNIEEFTAARQAVEAHCMCARIEEAAGKLIVYYPEGYDESVGPGGLRIDRDAVMLRRALEIMEHDWLASFPGAGRA